MGQFQFRSETCDAYGSWAGSVVFQAYQATSLYCFITHWSKL